MMAIDLPHILTTLGCATWPAGGKSRAAAAAALALTIYAGHTRDQGTPYLQHPLAVVSILRREIRVTRPETLLLGLLHDAFEVDPDSDTLVTGQLGEAFAARLRAMTPDHRLERRPKAPDDETRWQTKTAALADEELLVRLADRIHNLRDLTLSPNRQRREKFLRSLIEFYLPLAEGARHRSPELGTAYILLHAESGRHQQEARP